MNTQSKPLNNIFRGLIILSLALAANVSTAAAVLYQQAPVVDPIIDGFQSDISSGQINGDDFSVAHVNIQSIVWWGTYVDPDADPFEVKLFNDLSNYPASALSGFVSAPTELFNINQEEYYRYELILNNPLQLLAGDYFLSIQNAGLSNWFWLYGNPGNGNTIVKDPDWSVENSGVDMAFSLEGSRNQTIPEPNTLVLLLLGCSLLIIARKGMKNTLQA
ncbi:MAG: hypothetical protein CTY19_10705 [Methylomonas sp.]|nr:MAG: hypothetical protein CTY19_10705 [Methylomonas sp.]